MNDTLRKNKLDKDEISAPFYFLSTSMRVSLQMLIQANFVIIGN